MRLTILCGSLFLLAPLASLDAAAQTPAAAEAPTLAELRAAVDTLPPGRVERPTSYDALTPDQQRYVQGILTGPRNGISGPLVAMLPSPGLGELAQRTMAYARFAGTEGFSSVPPKLNELAVIMAAQAWSSTYVWNAHAGYSVRVGLTPAVVEAIRVGRRPEVMEPDVEAVYTFVSELLTARRVSDAVFEAARAALGGDRGIIDLVGTLAIYQMSAMLTVVDRTGLAEGEEPTLRPVD